MGVIIHHGILFSAIFSFPTAEWSVELLRWEVVSLIALISTIHYAAIISGVSLCSVYRSRVCGLRNERSRRI